MSDSAASAVKIVTQWGINWYKNASENGGAMKTAIANRKEGDIVIHSQSQKLGRMWGSCSSAKLCDLIKKNHGLYEVIVDMPHKLYFDIDAKKEPESPSVLPTIMDLIKSVWPEGSWAISGSNKPEKESYHIVSDTYVIHNLSERDMVKSAVKYLQTQHEAFDWKVYTPNRNMKCINQSKDDGRVQQIVENEDYKAHLICSFIPTYCKPIDCHFAEPLKEKIAIERANKKIDLSELPRLNLPTPDEINPFNMTAEQVLGLLPCGKEFDHNYTHMVARFCNTANLSFETFLSWLKKKHEILTSDIKNKWLTHWNNLHKFPPFTFERMKKVLFYYYPALKKDQYLNRFTKQFTVPNYVDITTMTRLSQEHYSDRHKFSVLNLTMGSGKTAQTINYLKNKYDGFIWLAHNKALVEGTLTRLKDAEVDCTSYLSIDTKAKKAGGLDKFKSLCICAHSLHYVGRAFSTVVIDEIESVVDAFMGDFMNKSGDNVKRDSFRVFKNLIANANKVILIDAFITMKTFNLLRLIDPTGKINLIVQADVRPSKTLIFKNTTRENEDDAPVDSMDYLSNAIYEICKYIDDNKKVFIFYPYKNSGYNRFSMQEMMDTIKSRTGKKVVMYNSDVDDKIKAGLKNVNETWSRYDCVICNSVVTCGVNFDLAGFDKVFMFLAPFVSPRQSIQVSARIRNLSSNQIIVYYMGRQVNPECYQDDRKAMNCKVYDQLYDDYIIEDQAPRRKSFEWFCMKAPYKMEVNKLIISKQITHEIEQYKKADFEFAFENIEDICSSVATDIEELVMQQEATMYEKFQLKKFYFIQKFNGVDGLDIIKDAWNLNMFGIVA